MNRRSFLKAGGSTPPERRFGTVEAIGHASRSGHAMTRAKETKSLAVS
jgi:hypothetical protein